MTLQFIQFKKTSPTNLFLRKISGNYKNELIMIIWI